MLTDRKTWYGISENEMFALASTLFFIMPHVIFSCDTQHEFNVLLSPNINTRKVILKDERSIWVFKLVPIIINNQSIMSSNSI
jgi:hypothetical protein